ncbi:hypothetical protein [Nocardia sp. NPDC004260]
MDRTKPVAALGFSEIQWARNTGVRRCSADVDPKSLRCSGFRCHGNLHARSFAAAESNAIYVGGAINEANKTNALPSFPSTHPASTWPEEKVELNWIHY